MPTAHKPLTVAQKRLILELDFTDGFCCLYRDSRHRFTVHQGPKVARRVTLDALVDRGLLERNAIDFADGEGCVEYRPTGDLWTAYDSITDVDRAYISGWYGVEYC